MTDIQKTRCLVLGYRETPDNHIRLANLKIVLRRLNDICDDSIDILIIEQDSSPRLNLSDLPGTFTYRFLYNPDKYNRGWGFNVAAREFCGNADILIFFDGDILPSDNLLSCIQLCEHDYDVVSPYSNVYFTSAAERDLIDRSTEIEGLFDTEIPSKPVTICGGVLIIKKAVFESVYGFEQYTGYGGEDRALDVALLNTVPVNRIYVSSDIYIHLYHPVEENDRSRTSDIMKHLSINYGCTWNANTKPTSFIHKDCNHKPPQQLELVIATKKLSYGDINLYHGKHNLSINGIPDHKLCGRRYLPEAREEASKLNYSLAIQLLEQLRQSTSARSAHTEIFSVIADHRLLEISRAKRKRSIYDFVFIPHKKYHAEELIESVALLNSRGYSAIILDISSMHPDEGAYLDAYQCLYLALDQYIYSDQLTKCIVCCNDWEKPVINPILRLAKYYSIPTVALVEGVNDFWDIDYRRAGSTASYRNAYGTAKFIGLNGIVDRKYFVSTSQETFVVGINRLRQIVEQKSKQAHKATATSQRKILINLNFSYFQFNESVSNTWLEDIVSACNYYGYHFIISKHPASSYPIGDYPVSPNDLYTDLLECDAFVTRFSGAVFEALAAETLVIYYNPSIERNDKFIDPMGVYFYASGYSDLVKLLGDIRLAPNLDNRRRFFELHAGGNLDDEYLPYLRLTDFLETTYRDYPVSDSTSTKFNLALRQHFSSGNASVVSPVNNSEETFVDPVYLISENVTFCQCINVDIENLHDEIVACEGKLYLLKSQKLFERYSIPPDIWNAQAGLLSEIIIHIVDFDILSIRAVGFLYDLSEIERTLKPGLSFIIRAKDEFKNIYFVLGSLRAVLRNKRLNCEVIFVDNNSSDGTYDEVVRVCRTQEIDNVYLYKYPTPVSRSGDEHSTLPSSGQMHRSLDTYYNWCLEKSNKYNIVKWDADFLAINDNLVDLIETYNLNTEDACLSVWCTGKTAYVKGDNAYLHLDTEYNEFRVFSKLHDYKWVYAPRWEICCPDYLAKSKKYIFSKAIFVEIKDCEINEFENRTNESYIPTCPRDTRDNLIINLVKAVDQDPGVRQKLASEGLLEIPFNPLVPVNYDTIFFNDLEATRRELLSVQKYWINEYSLPDKPIRFEHPDNIIVQGLWVGSAITDLHRICMQSFLNAGHCFVLYTYESVQNVPPGVVIMNAEHIMPSSLIYVYNGSYAGFSDLFRSKLMEVRGGWYVDLDIFCLKRLDLDCDTVFSLDHYSPSAPPVFAGDGLQIFPISKRFYCATNPLKLVPGTPLTRWMYSSVLKKILSRMILENVYSNDAGVAVSKERIACYLESLMISGDFRSYICDLYQLPDTVSFECLLGAFGISVDQVGQNTWNEIGPRLVSEAALRYASKADMFEPNWFQGRIPYYDVEKYIDPNYDFRPAIEDPSAYTVDLFFTMWKNKGLLDVKDGISGTFYEYLKRFSAS